MVSIISKSDIHQRVGIGMDRNNMDEILSLFDWSEEEEKQLRMLPWKSSYKDSLANRKYRHLCYLFEAVYAIALKPSDNITQNPTGEWELKYYG